LLSLTENSSNPGRGYQRKLQKDLPTEATYYETLIVETPFQVFSKVANAQTVEIEYPTHFETRYVSHNGGIRWNCAWVNVSITCAGEYVGLEEIDNGIWNVYFGPLKLGRLSEQKHAH
jgi:hypothetical protein